MNKLFVTSTIAVILLGLFSGCVSTHKTLDMPHYPPPSIPNPNDVDISDLDENLTESEMMLSENGEHQKQKRMPFPASEYYSLPKLGKGTISGTIYLSDNYGSRVVGKSTRLYLNPYTSYSEEWYEESYLGGAKMEKADPRLYNYLKFNASDNNGKFSFYGVPSGSYYLIGTVNCGQRCGFASPRNIRLVKRVTIYGNQIVKQDLTRTLH
jgi:hypothetical protein